MSRDELYERIMRTFEFAYLGPWDAQYRGENN